MLLNSKQIEVLDELLSNDPMWQEARDNTTECFWVSYDPDDVLKAITDYLSKIPDLKVLKKQLSPND